MILLLDENLPAKVAEALNALGTVEAYHVTKYLPRGTPDVEIFSFLKKKPTWILVTQDKNIKKRPQELAALKSAHAGMFVFTGRAERNIEEMLVLLTESLQLMRKHSEGTKRPFVFGISDRKRFDRLV